MKWFLAGLGIGVGLGIVMAPARGEESRRRLREGASRTWDEMSDEARNALDQMRSSDWARQARDVASQAKERVTAMKRDAQDRLGEVANTVREHAPDNIKQAVERVASVAGVDANRQQEGHNSGNGKHRGSLLELLNDASKDELIAVNGIGPVLALKIVQHRPYKDEHQPLNDNVIPPSAFEALRSHLKQSA
jgi:DNA uptake protein ComE-like DNA-binding protein